jgi:predicted DNA-binding mobile mystery protein A
MGYLYIAILERVAEMRDNFRELRSQQLDRTLAPLRSAPPARPPKGWIRAIREALGVSSGELAGRMGTNRSLVVQQEKAEAEDRITLKSLRAYANALDCDLIYALVPRADTLQELVGERARVAAKKNVLGVEHTMALENQASGNLEQAIEAEALRLARKRKQA